MDKDLTDTFLLSPFIKSQISVLWTCVPDPGLQFSFTQIIIQHVFPLSGILIASFPHSYTLEAILYP